MKIGRLCNRDVVVGWPDESIVDAARKMRDAHVGDLVVVANKKGDSKPIGVVTDRDIVVKVVATVPEQLQSLTIGDLLRRSVVTAWEDDSVPHALRLMKSAGVRRLPVLDADDRLVGLISREDLLSATIDLLSLLRDIVVTEKANESDDADPPD